MIRVVVTSEGYITENGKSSKHALKIWVNEKGQAVSIREGGHPIGVGRILDPKIIEGEVNFELL